MPADPPGHLEYPVHEIQRALFVQIDPAGIAGHIGKQDAGRERAGTAGIPPGLVASSPHSGRHPWTPHEDHELNTGIEAFVDCFDDVTISPPGWPAICSVVLPAQDTLQRWPGYPDAALPESGRAANGRGWTAEACRQSGVGEAIELASLCAWGDEKIVDATVADLPGRVLLPDAVNGFSAEQYRDREDWNDMLQGTDWIPPACEAERRIGWVEGADAGGDPVFLPADAVLIGRREAGDADAVAIADSNGCAAGSTASSTRLAALLELIERDATGRWWYGGHGARSLPVEASEFGERVSRHCARRGRRCRLFDITSDLVVPVVAALSQDEDGRNLALGFACRPDAETAVGDALCELMQMELLIEAARAGAPVRPGLASWLREVGAETGLPAGHDPAGGRTGAAAIPDDPEDALDFLLSHCLSLGCDVVFFDHTRPEFAVPVWRAVAPGLCHWKPRLGRSRLGPGGGGGDARRAPPWSTILRI
ncbi:MAG: hypothetical protein D6754_02500 [Alphaproteobacteria bacterium]|nr:MAG: hypothetical protein D6754_02500 [Alphaproteobacteria bacterium]